MSRSSKAYRCKGLHTSFISPTTKRKQHWSLKRLDFDEAASDSDDIEAVPKNVPSPSDLQRIPPNDPELRPVSPETSGQNQVRPQQLRYGGNVSSPNLMQVNNNSMGANTALTKEPAANTDSLKAELDWLRRKYNSLLEKHQALRKQSGSPKERTIQAIKSVLNKSKDLDKKKKKKKQQQQVEHFVSFIMDSSFFDGLVRTEIL